ncbi:hypothetical protein HJC23_000020 [Cyclotella cryptica]|uniref:Rhodanese domain-containing protein n=1 Tax=Cyclotella cryptica TaxID=29204 RepID=A0ABD3PEW9_9STRA|eukprot:CCRYP_016259-RB/>CCRYP_016259-RB protein AED:0.03 eAED:0.03 QI:110/1/1/1/0.33/0.25/4/1436/418
MTMQTLPQPYTTAALIRAMAPVDVVIDSFLREQIIVTSQSCESCDVYCAGGEHKMSPWSVPSQSRFASLIASISTANCASFDFDWTSCKFLPSQRYISKLVTQYIIRMEKEADTYNAVVELEDDHLVSLVYHLSMYRSTIVPDPCSSCFLTFQVPITMVSNEVKSTKIVYQYSGDHSGNEGDFLQIRTFPYHNDVGLKLWEAGACLAEYLIQYPEVIRAKNVMELGAGVGLTGLVAAVCGGCGEGARSVHMTDYTQATLENLRFNADVNAEWLKKRGVDVRNVSIGFLEWGDLGDCKQNDGLEIRQSVTNSGSTTALLNADVLLAADVVYDIHCIPDLVCTVNRFLSCGNSLENKKALFATTYRNKTTFDLFENELEKRGILCDYIPKQLQEGLPSIFPCYFNQQHADVRLCCMKLVV